MKPAVMNPSRRAVLAAFGAAVLLPKGASSAGDQGYPTKPVRVIVAWPPGSSADTSARMLAPKLAEALGQSFVIENRPGASGIIGAEAVARAAPDGYTLLFNTANHASNKIVFQKLPYDPIADFAPISMVVRNVLSIAVHPSLPVQNLSEFLQYAKARPGELSFGTPGLGTPHQLAGELLKQRAGIDMVHIPYKGGGPAVADLVSGQIPVSVASLVAVIPFMRAGRVRVIATTDPTRYDEFPDIPAVAETFPGFDVSGWSAMFAPAGTPAEIVNRLNAEITRILKTPEIRNAMNASGLVASISTPQALAKLVRDDINERWGLVVKSGAKFN
jgi:tripartite-type tricarboxylate transporter receptor subunit TctC